MTPTVYLAIRANADKDGNEEKTRLDGADQGI